MRLYIIFISNQIDCNKFTDTRTDGAKSMTAKHVGFVAHTMIEKVKQSRYRPGVAQRVPGSLGSQIT